MSSWANRPVAVTGAGGFIGSHLAEKLVEEGARVRALARYNSRGDIGALDWISDDARAEIEIVHGDIRDQESVTRFVEKSSVVFHLAAYIAIPYSYTDPRSFFDTNVTGTFNVGQACRAASVDRLVHTSTSEVYGTAQTVPITEEHPLVAQSPYAASKIGADQLVGSFHRSFGLATTIVRPFNTYGPRQSARAVIPTIISQALTGDTIRLGRTSPRRDLTFVGDTVSGFLAAAASDAAVGDTLQLGTGDDLSIGELVEEVAGVLGRELRVVEDEQRVRPEASEVMRLISSPRKMTELTGWEPATTLREGLAQTIEWIAAHPALYPTDHYVI